MITVTITNEEEVPGKFEPLTAAGNPAPIDGDVAWEILDGNSTLGDTEDGGKLQWLRSEDGVGTTHYKATADADLGPGFRELSETYEVVVRPPDAATVGSSFGTPRLKT